MRPAGYPLKSIFQECPSVADARLFELYAREQWYGEEVNPGSYLFDRRLYPDYAFQVIKAYPRNSLVGFQTTIRVEQKAEVKNGVSYDVSFDDVVGQDKAKRKVKIVEKYLQDPEGFGRWAPHNILFYGVLALKDHDRQSPLCQNGGANSGGQVHQPDRRVRGRGSRQSTASTRRQRRWLPALYSSMSWTPLPWTGAIRTFEATY